MSNIRVSNYDPDKEWDLWSNHRFEATPYNYDDGPPRSGFCWGSNELDAVHAAFAARDLTMTAIAHKHGRGLLAIETKYRDWLEHGTMHGRTAVKPADDQVKRALTIRAAEMQTALAGVQTVLDNIHRDLSTLKTDINGGKYADPYKLAVKKILLLTMTSSTHLAEQVRATIRGVGIKVD